MATATVRRHHDIQPMSYYWDVVKDMDDSQKLELVTMLIESVKPAMAAPSPLRRYTKEEMNALLDQAERDFEAGLGIPDEDVWRDMDEEYEKELAEEQNLRLEAV